jgi:hypothetical protein
MLSAARWALHAEPWTLSPYTLSPARCPLHAVPWTLSLHAVPARCPLHAVPCTLSPARCPVHAERCMRRSVGLCKISTNSTQVKHGLSLITWAISKYFNVNHMHNKLPVLSSALQPRPPPLFAHFFWNCKIFAPYSREIGHPQPTLHSSF